MPDTKKNRKKEDFFTNKYYDLQGEFNKLDWQAKKYILKHWEKVDDWTQLKITMRSGKESKIYAPEEITLGSKDQFIVTAEKVETVTDMVMDEIDGDFSLKINGTDWYWIDTKNVTELADYIREYLIKNEDDAVS